MARSAARRTTRRIRIRRLRVAGLLLVVAASVAVLVPEWPAASTSAPETAAPTTRVAAAEGRAAGGAEERGVPDRPPGDAGDGALGAADGAVPDGTTAFDDAVPGVARLDPALLDALRRATTDAAGEGVDLLVDSGWRSRAYQEDLLREAVLRYGSEEAAARWVATPDTSAHVSGDAVDVAPAAAWAWLTQRGAAYGLCQTYGNEPWHFELRPDAAEQGCPPRYADPTQDPRMQR